MQRNIPEGIHVRYYHSREMSYVSPKPIPKSKGGMTYCYLEDENNQPVVTGVAYCSPDDHYNKKIGRAVSLGRALKAYDEHVVSAATA